MRKPTRYTKEKAKGKSTDKTILDVWMQRTVWGVQILLFPLAILGYVFTVRPVYQKQLIDEQIAESKVVLRQTKETLVALAKERSRLTEQNSQLQTEAKQSYIKLRENLLGALTSIGSSCSYDDGIDGVRLYQCVYKAVDEQIAKYLNPTEGKFLLAALTKRRTQVEGLVSLITDSEREEIARRKRSIRQFDRIISAYPAAAIEKIYKLRGGEGPAPKTMKELGNLRTAEEVNIHNATLDAAKDALMNRTVLDFSSISTTRLGTRINDKLRDILVQVRSEARAGSGSVKHP